MWQVITWDTPLRSYYIQTQLNRLISIAWLRSTAHAFCCHIAFFSSITHDLTSREKIPVISSHSVCLLCTAQVRECHDLEFPTVVASQSPVDSRVSTEVDSWKPRRLSARKHNRHRQGKQLNAEKTRCMRRRLPSQPSDNCRGGPQSRSVVKPALCRGQLPSRIILPTISGIGDGGVRRELRNLRGTVLNRSRRAFRQHHQGLAAIGRGRRFHRHGRL